jgi:hypothetical protein
MEIRLCVDCRHYRRESDRQLDRCKAQIRIDFVRGEHLSNYATIQRETYGECGPEGKLFSPQEDLFTATETEASHVAAD